MSYDGWVELRLSEDDAASLEEIGNYTSNVAGMWSHALTDVQEEPTFLRDTDGMGCAEAAVTFRLAVMVMIRDEEQLRALEPGNGWGDYDGALRYLCRARDVCGRFAGVPTARVRWSS